MFFKTMFSLLSEAGRDLSARETGVSSKLKVTEQPFLCARFPGKKDKATFLLVYFSKRSGNFFSFEQSKECAFLKLR